VRRTLLLLLVFWCFAGQARAQMPLEIGSPESAFAGGPIHLSKNAVTLLRAHYQGDKVPLVPQPFRGKLDLALQGRDWPRVEVLKKGLIAAHGVVAALAWEQSRFIATGAIGVAEQHALDVAATGSTGLSETAVMLWFYSVAVTMTDGHKCVDEAAKEAHLDRLRGPAFEPVIRIIRTISDDRLTAMRDLAIRLETVLAVDRNDDTMCREGNGKADIKPDAVWRPEAALTRGMLPRHLVALASVMRPRPIARPEQPQPEPVKPVAAKPAPATPGPRAAPSATVEPVFPGAGVSLPMLPEPVTPESSAVGPRPVGATKPEAAPAPANSEPTKVESPPAIAKAEPLKPQPEQSEPANSQIVSRPAGQPNPARFEPPQLEQTTPDPPANH